MNESLTALELVVGVAIAVVVVLGIAVAAARQADKELQRKLDEIEREGKARREALRKRHLEEKWGVKLDED